MSKQKTYMDHAKELSKEAVELVADIVEKHDAAILEEMHDRMKSLQASNQRMREALEELVALKDMKTLSGDSPDYRKRKPLAWASAREVLAKE